MQVNKLKILDNLQSQLQKSAAQIVKSIAALQKSAEVLDFQQLAVAVMTQ